MPHKFNVDHRDKIPKQKHSVTNWAEHNRVLRQRGDVRFWISEDALGLWSAPRRKTRDGQRRYSDLAIELCLTLGMVFHQPLRQTQGFMRSSAALLEVEIAVPDFSTLSRRGSGLILSERQRSNSHAPIHLVVDSTGLKVFGEGEWLEEKHKTKRKRCPWRKLHLGLDLVSGEIVCADLSRDEVGDPTARDYHIAKIATNGRMAWQKANGYNQRSRAETLMGRWKAVIGPKLKARAFENQRTEAQIGVRILNRMTERGRPRFERTA